MPESEDGFTPRLVDSLVDAVVVIEDTGRVIYANPALGRLLGYRPEHLLGAPLGQFLPERLQAGYTSSFMEWMASDPPPRSPGPSRIAMVHADGSEIPVDVGTFLVAPERGPRLVIAALWDAHLRIDIDRYQRVADELMAFLAGASGSTDDVVPGLLKIVAESLDFDFATAWRWDGDVGLLHCEHTWCAATSPCDSMIEASDRMSVRPGEGLAGYVVSLDEPRWFSELTTTPHLRRHTAIVTDGMQSAFIFPIRTKEHLVGVVELFSRQERRPDRALLDAIANVGTRLGEFIERLELEAQRNELIAQLERSKHEQDFLLRANVALAGAHDFRDAVRMLAETAVPTLGDICLIDVVNPNGTLERLAARHADPNRQALTDELGGHPPDLHGSHPAAIAIREGEPQWSPSMADEFMRDTTQSRTHLDLTKALHFHSYVSVPLDTGTEIIGALTMVSTHVDHRFGDQELHLAQGLARQVARAIERARTYDDQATIAHQLQNSLLPPIVSEIPGIDVAVRYEASGRGAQVGGDFYDLVPLDGNRIAMVMGDVEGHDMVAATIMGQLHSAIRAFLYLGHDPGSTLGLLDDFLFRQSVGRMATAVVATLDVHSGDLEIASAGHPPPMVGASNHPMGQLQLVPGPPVGFRMGRYPMSRLLLEWPAVLAFYTDGLIDEGHTDGSKLLATMGALLSEYPSMRSEDMIEAILRDIRGEPAADDKAVMLVKLEDKGAPIEAVPSTDR